jgi:Domain of unknown function (DUF1874).
MKLYIANAFSLSMLTKPKVLLHVQEITVDEAQRLIKNIEARSKTSQARIISAVGHESTARVLSTLLDYNIPMNRIPIQLETNDILLVFQLMQRLPEGAVLTEDELRLLQYKLYKVTVKEPLL